MTVKYFYDLMSQPSRALFIYFKLIKFPIESCPVQLRNREHLTSEFKTNFSKFQKVPFIHDGNFRLNESVAILRYLVAKYHISNKWYPVDLEKRALVDEYLEWQHLNTRAFAALYFRTAWIMPLVTGNKPDPKTIEKMEKDLNKCLDSIEDLFLSKNQFICGEEITIADIFAACEIEQPRVAGFDVAKGRPILGVWLERVKQETNPYYDEAHAIMSKLAKLNVGSKVESKL